MIHLIEPSQDSPLTEMGKAEEAQFQEHLAAERKRIVSKGHITMRYRSHCPDCAALDAIETAMGFVSL